MMSSNHRLMQGHKLRFAVQLCGASSFVATFPQWLTNPKYT